ncbi:hypothetical protein [Rhodococcus sp. ACPA1]|uniref:hypothetical protein n=1 Tax=Rhodococcus sp. ACPA1 TaxID=2028572 RepID=UPI0015CD0C64|nr:hypothetical protein [Rhodococcus sp. ACPA1]
MLIGTHGFPDETPDHQVDVLCHAGVAPENIPVDHAVGAKVSRHQLDLVLQRLGGDGVVVITPC